ncbi:MAG: nucleotidyltransferase [Candidatus Marinimicrobia bacterium]|nr:nucleotidyltransferase [Candidatus Neomarinimicrobiota bacterium]MBT3502810.1 nucleotidyltransferase [Candidatus Neomarinimicrobiota bacterium]MBT3839152.1 nucleotidyltransferase [Candidatus Neomarinimicrobiota bacterium]MBT4000375.1 nucleotidyltransferase [Candidatus Neomarinimicrobiota bacterium]MBT4283642.1 nucleotidyltransferase [Candidatus Neomarinimicrobiota bacterium]
MNNITLLIMAAGMGSRYGGLKQLDAVGPSGETIIDYSVYDAIEAGFNKVVFIIRKDFEQEFKSRITDKYEGKIQVEFAFQDLNDLPDGFECPNSREKPWGTGHAILSARDLIREPFVAINGDDYYGRESFKVVADYYNNGANNFSMVAFQLDKTLSIFGGVTRGLCTVMDNKLETVIETSNLQKMSEGVSSDRDIKLSGNEPVSMNVWGFTPILFEYLQEKFIEFLNESGSELKSEYLIPSVVNELIQDGKENVHVLLSGATWFGVTYKEDKPFVESEILKLIRNGEYPENLFG